jgi:hypothetical protein
LELCARWWQAGRGAAHSYAAPRNADFRRNWAPYTAPRDRPEGKPLIVVVGGSQGFLSEQDDGSLAYAPRLAAGLAAAGVEAIVANWSVPAAQAPELVILAARAAEHAPDLVVLSSGTRAFAAEVLATAPLSYWLSDVPDMAYEAAVRRRLPRGFLVRNSAYDPLPFLRSHSALVRFRDAVERRDELWTWHTEPDIRRNKWQRLRLEEPNVAILRTLLEEFSSALRPPGADTPLLVINMPIGRRSWRRATYPRTSALSTVAEALFAADPHTTVLDARDAVPDKYFTTATHMSPAGHQAYADWLLPHVLEALSQRHGKGP